MYEDFLIKNDWLGAKHGESYYLYHTRDKKFAVFESEEQFLASADRHLPKPAIEPDPDFTFRPTFAAITLTTKCNMECPYCYVKPVHGFGEISAEATRQAVRALAALTEDELVIYAWGGEPTQNPKALLAMLDESQKYPHVKILLISNGVMESELLKKLLTYQNLVFQISFDGLAAENHQKPLISRDDSLVGMLTSMETISQISKRVSLRATVTRRNVEELLDHLVPTAKKFTNRVVVEHLHTFNGRATALRHEAPSAEDYVRLVFALTPSAEEQGVHVKVLPLDHLRAGGPNDKMTFLNVLTDGNITVSNAIIHSSHEDFSDLHIGKVADGHIVFDEEKNALLTKRYLDNYHAQCHDCFARAICHGSVQRYLFITHDPLREWDDLRCQYFRAIVARWIEEMIPHVAELLRGMDASDGFVQLIQLEGKIHYPMFVMKDGLSLSYRPMRE
jgi:radical SAM protein with 4Fe4S-binding SPASM domain